MPTRFRDWPFDTNRTPPPAEAGVRDLFSSAVQTDPASYIAEFRSAGAPMASRHLAIAAESIQAAIEQLAPKYSRKEQCLLLLVHALEILIRGTPDEIVRSMDLMGQAQWAAQNPMLFRSLAKTGKDAFDWCRSVREQKFVSAFSEVHELFNLSRMAELRFDDIYGNRNVIAHEGGTSIETLPLMRCILLESLPIVDEVLFTVYGFELENLVGPQVYRELLVAGVFLNMLFLDRKRVDERRTEFEALHPFRVAFRLGSDGPSTSSLSTAFREADDPQDHAYLQVKLPYLRHPHILGIDSEKNAPKCRICGARCMVQFEPRIRENIGMQVVKPLAVRCTSCGLFLTERNSDLTRIHYGYLDSDSLAEDLWSNLINQINNPGK